MGILAYILPIAFFSFGWCNLFNEKMIFEKAGKWLDAHLPEWISKPLYGCPICNAVWVTFIMAAVQIVPHDPWWFIPTVALSASGVASVIIGFQNKLEDIADQL